MATVPPHLWTVHEFRIRTGSTGVFAKARGLLAIIDEQLVAWNDGNCIGRRKQTLYRIMRECHHWLQAKQDKQTDLVAKRSVAVNTLAQQAFARYQYEHFETRKRHATPNQRVRSLQGGYRHERITYIESDKTMALSGSTVSSLIKNAPSIGLKKPPSFNSMTTTEFGQLIDEYAEGMLLEPEVRFFTKQERIGRLAVILNGRFYSGPRILLDTQGDEWAFVIDAYGNLYTTDQNVESTLLPMHQQRFNHSTLNAGKEVICAGILMADQGYLTYIDNASGHYKPTRRNVFEALTLFESQGYDFVRRPCTVRVMEMVKGTLQWSVFDNPQTLINNRNARPDRVE